MDSAMNKVCEILDNCKSDELVPLDTIKQCIAQLEEEPQTYGKHIDLLRSQIGVWGSDDTSMFSAQLVSARLKKALLDI